MGYIGWTKIVCEDNKLANSHRQKLVYFWNPGRCYLNVQGQQKQHMVSEINTKDWKISTSQSKSTDAAVLSRDCTSEFFNSFSVSPDKLFKKAMVSVNPCKSPWSISKSSQHLPEPNLVHQWKKFIIGKLQTYEKRKDKLTILLFRSFQYFLWLDGHQFLCH